VQLKVVLGLLLVVVVVMTMIVVFAGSGDVLAFGCA